MIRYITSKPADYHNGFEGYLYNADSFLSLKDSSIQSFYAVDDSTHEIVAQIHFEINNIYQEAKEAVSLPRSPFGSVEFADRLTAHEGYHFLCHVVDSLKKQQVSYIEIRHYAAAYDLKKTEILINLLAKAGFRQEAAVQNHHVPVDQASLASKMHPWEIRKLKKCQSASFVFKEETLSALGKVYEFIHQCRQQQQRQLSLNYTQLAQQAHTFPSCYHLFAVYDQQQVIAAAITVRVGQRILYTFYYAGAEAYGRYSPTVMLLNGIYQFCQNNDITMMDLGTSPSESVGQFKAQMGGKVSDKFTFKLAL